MFLLVRLVRVKRVFVQEKASDTQMHRSPSNKLMPSSSGKASIFRLGFQFACWVVPQCQLSKSPLMTLFLAKSSSMSGSVFLFLPSSSSFSIFTKIPPIFFHPNVVKILIGCSVQNMLYHLDLSLLEVLFIYTIKMSGKEIFSLSAHIPSLQLVTGLPDSTKGASKGHVVVLGPWVSSYEHPDHLFEPRCSLGISLKQTIVLLFYHL